MNDSTNSWVYRGVWGSLVRFLRVPKGPPGAPPGAGKVLRSIKPAVGFFKYMKLQLWLVLGLIDLGLLVGWMITWEVNERIWLVLTPVFLAAVVVPAVVGSITIRVRYDTTWYIMTERGVRIRRGVWNLRENTITFENVQNVEVRQGPVQRLCGISDVLIQTAGGGTTVGPNGVPVGSSNHGLLEGIDGAAELRDLIMQKALASRGAGLGDGAAEPSAQAGLSPVSIRVLREIRDALTPSAPTG